MDNLMGHTWCDCLQCDRVVEAMSILIVEYRNRDTDLGIALVHFTHDDETSYSVFGEMYSICHRSGNILDPMYYDDDDDEDDPDPWEPDDDCCGYPLGEENELDGSLILRMLRR